MKCIYCIHTHTHLLNIISLHDYRSKMQSHAGHIVNIVGRPNTKSIFQPFNVLHRQYTIPHTMWTWFLDSTIFIFIRFLFPLCLYSTYRLATINNALDWFTSFIEVFFVGSKYMESENLWMNIYIATFKIYRLNLIWSEENTIYIYNQEATFIVLFLFLTSYLPRVKFIYYFHWEHAAAVFLIW